MQSNFWPYQDQAELINSESSLEQFIEQAMLKHLNLGFLSKFLVALLI